MPAPRGVKHYKRGVKGSTSVAYNIQNKEWKSSMYSVFDIERMDYLINNDLPIEGEYITLGGKYAKSKKHGDENL